MLHEDDEKELFQAMIDSENELIAKWEAAKEELKDLIHPKYFDFAESNETYSSEGIVEIEEVEVKERRGNYKEYKHCRVKGGDGDYLYMLTDGEVETFTKPESQYEGEKVEYWVFQQTGYLGDDYYGYLLLPLNDGKRYWKINYSC
jgi:hypothetical protein